MEGNVRLFEIGAVFAPDAGALPKESLHVGALLMGASRPPHFTEPTPPAYDAWDARRLGERLATAIHGPVESVPGEGNLLWTLMAGGREVGRVLRLAFDRPVWSEDAYGVEVWMGVMESAAVAPAGQHAPAPPDDARPSRVHPRFRPLPSFPAAVRPGAAPAVDGDGR
jgi:phenylalanyl-tRNA synthetase beta chain